MTEIEEAAARSAIREVMAAYNQGGDLGRLDELLDQFAEDGVYEAPGRTMTGRAAIESYLVDVRARRPDLQGNRRHHLTTSRIEFDTADEARGRTYWFLMRDGGVLQEGAYIDRFVRREGRWRIAHRRLEPLWLAEGNPEKGPRK
jgi:ketosteroid isomerase-like protein